MTRTCPSCQGSVESDDVGCPCCGAKLERGLLSTTLQHASRKAGTTIARYDFRSDPLPGATTRLSPFDETLPTLEAEGGRGLQVSLRSPNAYAYPVPNAGARDVACSFRVTALGDSLYLGVVARRIYVADVSIQVLFSIQPHARRFELARIAMGRSTSVTTVLADGTSDAIGFVGVENLVDLHACAGSLVGLVNGREVCAVHDPSLGAGAFGLWIEKFGHDGTAREAVLTSFEARRISR